MAVERPGAGTDLVWLGVDVGTQGVRTVVLDAHGRELGTGSAPLTRDVREGARHEQDPQEWWTAMCAATSAATAQLAGRPLGAMAIDSTSGTVVVQDGAGRARGSALMYDDARAVDEADELQRAGEPLWSALGYRMQRSWALPRALWLSRAGALSAGDLVVHQADYLASRLAGTRVATDTSHALKTGYDLLALRWPAEVLDAVGLSTDVFPEVVLPGVEVGTVSAAAAAQSGVPEGTTIRAGMTDGCAAQIAARALTPGSWSSALGTTLVVKGATNELLRDPTGAVYCHRNPDGGWLPGGASSTGAGIVAARFAGADLDQLTRDAAGYEPAPGTTYPLLGHGERFPFLAPAARGFSDGVPDSEPVRFAATLQGIAFVERLAYDVLGSLGADVSGPVTFSGGATRNAYWNQLRSDILGRPVLLPESVQAAAGMAVLAAAPTGELGRTAETMVRIAHTYEPDRERGARFADAYAALRSALTERGWLDVAGQSA